MPLVLPEVDKYLPTESGEPPLARAKDWKYKPHSSSPQGGESQTKPRWQTAADSTWNELKERSKELRNNQTDAEAALWQHLRNNQLGFKFRRQQVIGSNIVDFCCLDKKLVIEVDGEIHKHQKEYDAARTAELESIGYKVIRFDNNRVYADIENVINEIKQQLQVLPVGEDLGGASYPYEHTTMPGWAGSSWYFLRYMDAHNNKEFADKKLSDYWKEVDLYIGGSEHATGHLLYVRFWTKALKDLGYISIEEPAKKLINQGMIQGRSNFVYRVFQHAGFHSTKDVITVLPEIFVSYSLAKRINEDDVRKIVIEEINNILKSDNATTHITYSGQRISKKVGEEWVNNGDDEVQLTQLHIDVNLVSDDILDINKFKKSSPNAEKAFFISDNGKFTCSWEIEKMSKSKYNVVTPDIICEDYGADCLRLYEMFLGPLEQSKPWNTNGITGVHGFLKKLWRLFHSPSPVGEGRGEVVVTNTEPTKAELKALHKSIKKITEDIERFSFNTSVSNFMILVNELTDLKCNKRAILEPLLIILSPYAPHITEELWHQLGHKESIALAPFPIFNEAYLIEDNFAYPISFNGKTRFNIELPLTLSQQEIEKIVMEAEQTHKYLEGKTPKKVIVVPKKIVNIVM